MPMSCSGIRGTDFMIFHELIQLIFFWMDHIYIYMYTYKWWNNKEEIYIYNIHIKRVIIYIYIYHINHMYP